MLPPKGPAERLAARPASEDARGGLLESFAGLERILGIVPFVADVSSTPRWHHLLFTEDKIIAVPAYAEPGVDARDLFLPGPGGLSTGYPTLRAAFRLVAIPQPLTPRHITTVIPYAAVRYARLRRGQGPKALPELVIRAGRHTTWWFLQKEDETADEEKACYARDLLLALLPFPVALVGFSDAPRPVEWHLRRGLGRPLPLLLIPRAAERPPLPFQEPTDSAPDTTMPAAPAQSDRTRVRGRPASEQDDGPCGMNLARPPVVRVEDPNARHLNAGPGDQRHAP